VQRKMIRSEFERLQKEVPLGSEVGVCFKKRRMGEYTTEGKLHGFFNGYVVITRKRQPTIIRHYSKIIAISCNNGEGANKDE